MAKRPVYVVLESGDEFIEERFVEFEWFKGFSVSQKQKSIKSLHKEFNKVEVGKNILEISSKSDVEHGVLASAFNLPIKTIEGKKICTLESLFQSCKKFEKGGPYKDILTLDSLEAKKDERLKKSGDLLCFEYKGEEWSLEPKTHFYDWIYINALYQNKDLVEKIVQYDAFTDIEFNPKKSINNQARAAALFVSLYRRGMLKMVLDNKDYYLSIMKIKYTEQLKF
ncbi:hypothetical protein P5E87_04805 [Clostridium perfringens]|nr:hypothetical protein [Clostridium perfringens]MDK0762142.1 hypothetical protein [Clostridium perfringens]MDM0906643.1 hypothetical protein [Clostridium perfringens]